MIRFFFLCWLIFPFTAFAQRGWDTIPYNPDYYKARLEKFRKEPVVKNKVLFLGNSITEAGDWKKLLHDTTAINRGISGDITYGILNRVDEAARRQPSRVYLLIGINDIAKNIPDEVIMENIFSIAGKIRSASPKTVIFIQSLLPTSNAFKDFPDHKNKDEHILIINAQLQRYGDRLKYTYVDLYSAFTNAEGKLDSKYTADGLHLNAAGYERWAEIIRKLK